MFTYFRPGIKVRSLQTPLLPTRVIQYFVTKKFRDSVESPYRVHVRGTLEERVRIITNTLRTLLHSVSDDTVEDLEVESGDYNNCFVETDNVNY